MITLVCTLLFISVFDACGKSSSYWKDYGMQWAQYGQDLGEYYTRKYASPHIPCGPAYKHSKRKSKRGGPEKGVYYGPATLKNKVISAVTINGPATVNNVTVEKSLDVHGPLTAYNLHGKGMVSVKGVVNGEGINVPYLEVMGHVDIEASDIETLELYTSKSYLSDSRIGVLKVKDKKSRPATIKIYGKSSVKEIVFASGKGTVIIDPSVSLNPKNVSGGSVKLRKK